MATRCVVAALLFVTLAFASSRVDAQSGSRGVAGQQLGVIRGAGTVRNNSISAIINNDLARGNAATEVRNSIGQLGLTNGPTRRPARSTSASFSTVNRRTPVQKPFTGASRSPSVSPYLGLFVENFDPNAVNYNTIVQPLQQQQNITRQLQRQQQESRRLQQAQSQQQAAVNLRLQQLSARPAFNPSGSRQTPPTGHAAVFGNTLRYYGGR